MAATLAKSLLWTHAGPTTVDPHRPRAVRRTKERASRRCARTVREPANSAALDPDHVGEGRIGRGKKTIRRQCRRRGDAVGKADRGSLAVVVPRAQPAREKSDVGGHGDDLHADVGEQCQVGVYVVGIALEDSHKLIENLGRIRSTQKRRTPQQVSNIIGAGFSTQVSHDGVRVEDGQLRRAALEPRIESASRSAARTSSVVGPGPA